MVGKESSGWKIIEKLPLLAEESGIRGVSTPNTPVRIVRFVTPYPWKHTLLDSFKDVANSIAFFYSDSYLKSSLSFLEEYLLPISTKLNISSIMDQLNIHIPGLAGANAFTRTLNKDDVDICVAVEEAFVEAERCSKEKV